MAQIDLLDLFNQNPEIVPATAVEGVRDLQARYPYRDWISEANAGVDNRIAGLTASAATYNRYSVRDDVAHQYTHNPNAWFADLHGALSCVSAWTSVGWKLVAVGPQLCITAQHVAAPVGTTAYWTDANNVTYGPFTVTATQNAGGDLCMVTLDKPLPASIKFAVGMPKLVPPYPNFYGCPTLFINQKMEGRVGAVNLLNNTGAGGMTIDSFVSSYAATPVDRRPWTVNPTSTIVGTQYVGQPFVNGDSTSPSFFIFRNQVVLLGLTYTYTGGGPDFGAAQSNTNSTLTSYAKSKGVTLRIMQPVTVPPRLVSANIYYGTAYGSNNSVSYDPTGLGTLMLFVKNTATIIVNNANERHALSGTDTGQTVFQKDVGLTYILLDSTQYHAETNEANWFASGLTPAQRDLTGGFVDHTTWRASLTGNGLVVPYDGILRAVYIGSVNSPASQSQLAGKNCLWNVNLNYFPSANNPAGGGASPFASAQRDLTNSLNGNGAFGAFGLSPAFTIPVRAGDAIAVNAQIIALASNGTPSFLTVPSVGGTSSVWVYYERASLVSSLAGGSGSGSQGS